MDLTVNGPLHPPGFARGHGSVPGHAPDGRSHAGDVRSGMMALLMAALRTPLAAGSRSRFLTGLLAGLLAAPGAGAAAEDTRTQAVRLEGEAFDRRAVVRILGAPEGKDAAQRALDRLAALGKRFRDATETLNEEVSASREVPVASPVADLLERTLQFCDWSQGAHGPLGGALRVHWEAAAGNPEPPPAPPFATESAACERLGITRGADGRATASIAAGSRLQLEGFAQGFAVDRAVDILGEAGIDNALIRLGRIHRAVGPGPEGKGWPVLLPVFEGYDRPLDEIVLRDASLALVWRADWPVDRPLFVDQRSGELPDPIWATAVVSELAVDAQALAVSALVLGAREGRFRMAGLRPVPSVLWLQGRGQGRPLIMELNWSDLRIP